MLRTFCVGSLLLLVASCTTPQAKNGLSNKGPDGSADDPGDIVSVGPKGDGTQGDGDGGLEPSADGGIRAGTKARVVSVAPNYALADEQYKYRPKSNQAEDTTWTIEKGPRGAKVAGDGTIEWTPESDQKGKHELKIVGKVGAHSVEQIQEITVALTDERASVEVSEKEGGSAVVTAPNSKVRGASVTVRPSTLKEARRLSIAETDVAPDMPLAKQAPRAVHFGPSGTVFSEPALISLPISTEESVDKDRVGAFVYDTSGKWVRVPVVAVDEEQGLVYAKAKHFSMYAAAQSKLSLKVSASAAAASSACEGSAVVDAWVNEPITIVDVHDVVGLPATLQAQVEGSADGLLALLKQPGLAGSVRFVRAIELGQGIGDARVTVATQLLVTTLFLKGDGTAKVVHSDALGNVQSSFDFASLVQSLDKVWEHVSGRATRAIFKQPITGAISATARLHVRYDEGDATLDAISADDLGLALADSELSLVDGLVGETGNYDVDCDGLRTPYDSMDSRLLASIQALPPGVLSTTVGTAVELSATLLNTTRGTPLSWRVLAGSGALSAIDNKPQARNFVARAAGRFQVEVSSDVDGEKLSYVFAIDASAAPAVLPSCTPSPVSTIAKQNDTLSLSAVLSESSVPASALSVEWGLMVNGAFTSSAELVGVGKDARLVPLYASRYAVACRARAGSELGAQRSVDIDVVAPQQNLLPTDLVLSPASSNVQPGQLLSMAASGRDPEGQPLRFTWTAQSGATLTTPVSQSGASRAQFSASAPGLYEVRVTIRDQSDNPQDVRAYVLVAADTSGADNDRDGWPAKLDCNDNDAKVHPGAIDRCGDNIDDDCSGDAKQSDCDNDGFTIEQGDCYDLSRDIRPGAFELCDGFDNNCDGRIDESYRIGESCSVGRGSCSAQAQWTCSSDAYASICPAKPQAPQNEQCDGVDNDCDGAVDEGYVAHATSCGVGACASTGMSQCVQGREQQSCQPRSPAPTDLTCDGVDDDCDGSADEDFVKLPEVCNGFDDDCDGRIDDNITCSATGTSGCKPTGNELCNGLDDDCDGMFDEGNVCGTMPAANSLSGAFWECADAACLTYGNSGFMFLSNGSAMRIETFDHMAYDPAHGPYCVEQLFQFNTSGSTFSAAWVGDSGTSQGGTGTFTVNGARATLTFLEGPADVLGVTELVRVPEQPGGSCPRGPVCETHEICGNGFDDNCDGYVDAGDPECRKVCSGTPTSEVCDLLDNDCNGLVDDMQQTCIRNDAQGICRNGKVVCAAVAGGQPSCQAGVPEPRESCGDGLDNDCDGATDETDCTPLSPGESCFNAIDVTNGGVFFVAQGERNDVAGGCRPTQYNDRVFVLNTPPGQMSSNYTIRVSGPEGLDVGAALYQAPAAYVPGQACPAFDPYMGICIGREYPLQQYLNGGNSYFLVVESVPDNKGITGNIMVSVGRRALESSTCVPGDGDGDGSTICAGDCNDTASGIHPEAPELCNQLDDDCDGMVDEQDGNCPTGRPGACAVGLPACGQTPSCQPVQHAAREYCDDGVDNDCNGATDETGCVVAAGESCGNPVDLGTGGAFEGTLVGASDDAVTRCGGEGPERFYRFSVPQGGGYVRLMQRGYRMGERYALYRSCSLEVVDCDFHGGYLEAGDYRLAVEMDAHMVPQAYAFTLSISGNDNRCLTPDIDGDGQDACTDDCDEGNPLTNGHAREAAACDGLDNDCNGMIDDIDTHCVVPGLQGVCADGRVKCEPNGANLCVQTHYPDPQSRDICGDGLDNDCDGSADTQDQQGCVTVPAGDVCSLASQVDISAGGTFSGSLAGYHDDHDVGCGDYGSNGTERFYTITLRQRRTLIVQAVTPYVAGDTGYISTALLRDCDFSKWGANSCAGSYLQQELDAGTYVLAVFGTSTRNYELRVATRDVGDVTGATCSPGDSDGDGFTLCNGDCREGDRNVHQGAQEVCDGLDNDCNMMVDDYVPYNNTPCTATALGECSHGALRCEQGEMRCVPAPMNAELCNDGRDNDCDGVVDEQGPGNCQMADAETCNSAQPIPLNGFVDGSLVGAQDNGYGCYGGAAGTAAERYYRFDVPAPGYYYLQVAPRNGSTVAYSAGIFAGDCAAPLNNQGCSSMGEQVVWYYLSNTGPHYVVVEADQALDYRIRLATGDASGNGSNCSAVDQDGDGSTLCNYDCDEQNRSRFPGAPELCNNIDDNCNGTVDEACK